MGKLSDKVAVITGGGGVLCSAIAAGLAQEGVRCVLFDLAEDKAQAALDKVRHAGSDGLAIKTNVLSWADLTQAAEETLAAWTS